MSRYDESWPAFLGLLDSNPKLASAEFTRFCLRLLEQRPPRVLSGMSADDRHDTIQDILLHCLDKDFRILRLYVDRGSPFSKWLMTVAWNVAMTRIRKTTSENSKFLSDSPINEGSDSIEHPDRRQEPTVEEREALQITEGCLSKLGESCQRLVRLAAEEFLPREIAELLKLPAAKAKKISDDLRFCRKKLLDCVVQHGVRLDFLLAAGKD